MTFITGKKIRQEYDYRTSIGFKYHETDIKWNMSYCIKFPLYGFFSGMFAGLLGIGNIII